MMKTLISKSASLAAILTLILFTFINAQVHATGDTGQITGQLQDGSNHNVAVANQQVTLQVAQNGNAQDLTNITTNAQGMYTFSDLDTDKTRSYAIYTHYQGAQYVTNLITLASNPMQQVNLIVYESTQDNSKIAITNASILINEPSVQTQSINVSEVFNFDNLDTHTYVGSLDSSHGKPNALLFSLPPGAANVSVGQGFTGYHVIQVDRGFASDAAIPPGDTQLAFTFDIPYTAAAYDLSYTAMYPTVEISFLVPPDLHASSNALTAQGQATSGSNQHPYNLYKANLLPAQKSLTLHLTGLVVPQMNVTNSDTSSQGSSDTTWLIIIIALMLLILLATWLLLRYQRGRQPQKHRMKGQQQSAARTTKASKGTRSTHEQQELLQQLLDLDRDYEAGKLKKAAYQEQRNATKARLRELKSGQEVARR